MKKSLDKNKGLSKILTVLLIFGMLVSAFLAYEHFAETASEFCTFGDSFDCGIVNKSPYANLDGLSYLLTIDLGLNLPMIDIASKNVVLDFLTSNAVLGFLVLMFVLLLNTSNIKEDFLWIKRSDKLKWIRGILVFGVAYGGYLFFIQHSLLKTYCIFCLALDFTMLACVAVAFSMKND